MSTAALTLYVDGNCPICMMEVRQLRARDADEKLAFVDIALPSFDPAPLGVSLAALNAQMHAWTAEGECLIGIDALIAAYTLTGRGWLVAPLRVPALRPAARVLYRTFARNRLRVSRWLRVRAAPDCVDGACATKTYGDPRSKP
ncbi:thiol-disulfide oxidoreductase DCC family protein [Pandoraea pneumonica]|uniref:thiol-disulfide oxidoreductase DCC family protein n=1 Tax=Pandoraea pneumonica TaxID=2508299 RepID=UPI003CF676B0